MIITCE